jgi:hypothetical protein
VPALDDVARDVEADIGEGAVVAHVQLAAPVQAHHHTVVLNGGRVLTLPRLKPGDSRFSAAAYATAPRRASPALSMFLAALWSRCRLVPQSGQECQRTDKPLETVTPQPAHVWLV